MLQFTAGMLLDMAELREFNKNAWRLLASFDVQRPEMEAIVFPQAIDYRKQQEQAKQRTRLKDGPSIETIAEAFRTTGVSEREVAVEARHSRSYIHYVKTGQRIPDGQTRQNIFDSIFRVQAQRVARRG